MYICACSGWIGSFFVIFQYTLHGTLKSAYLIHTHCVVSFSSTNPFWTLHNPPVLFPPLPCNFLIYLFQLILCFIFIPINLFIYKAVSCKYILILSPNLPNEGRCCHGSQWAKIRQQTGHKENECPPLHTVLPKIFFDHS